MTSYAAASSAWLPVTRTGRDHSSSSSSERRKAPGSSAPENDCGEDVLVEHGLGPARRPDKRRLIFIELPTHPALVQQAADNLVDVLVLTGDDGLGGACLYVIDTSNT